MRVTFVAYGAGAYLDQGPPECGVSGEDDTGEDRYLTFRWDTERGIYFEADGPDSGAWDCIGAIRVGRQWLNVDLAAPVPGLPDVEGFDVRLDVDADDFATFSRGVREVFRNSPASVRFI